MDSPFFFEKNSGHVVYDGTVIRRDFELVQALFSFGLLSSTTFLRREKGEGFISAGWSVQLSSAQLSSVLPQSSKTSNFKFQIDRIS